MLGIRGKTILIISAIVLGITVSTLGAGLFISRYRFMETVKLDLLSMSRIAASMLSSETAFLKQETHLFAERISRSENVQAALDSQIKNSRYLTLSVMERDSPVVLYAGNADGRPLIRGRESSFGRRAFAGETVITTTMHTADENLAMYIWAPIDETRVLVATLPGLYLSNFISRFRIWGSGGICVVDNDGVIIANSPSFRVTERHNYIEWGKRDPEYRTIGETIENIITNDEGNGRYILGGVDYMCAYSAIRGTDQWSLAVTAPLAESPLSQIQQMLFLFAAVFLGLGLIAALVAANSIAVPYEKMEELRWNAEAASESKTRFLANMSHEMRTPLNAIIGLSELELGLASLQGDSFTNVEKIYSAGMNLLGIINDLLDISKIESGKFTMVPVVYDLPSMINDTVNLNIVRIGSKPIQFRLHLSGSLPSRLKGDELRVKQVFNNLLSNAFKYTDSGFVDWSLSCRREENRVKVTSTIRDTGIGIRKDDLAKLFKDYYQANRRVNYHVEGTGLGLSITHNLVKLMGGAISVKSDYGRGSVFTVEFFQEAMGDETIGDDAAENLSHFRYSAQRRSRNQKLIRADMSYATVLVVDDVVTNLDVTRGMLKPYGIAVDCVTSGDEAIKRVREEKVRYDAVFMDHMMPGMDGVEAVKIIRHDIDSDYAKTVPIIALTANALLGNDSIFLENGFQAFLSKPIDILRLDQILNQWVRDKTREKNRTPPAAAAVEKIEKKEQAAGIFRDGVIPGLNTAQGLARFENDEESYLRILRSFTVHVPNSIETAKNVSSDTLADYRVAVHSVKGSGRGIGAEQLGDQAEKLEKAAVNGDLAFIEANNGRFVETAEQLIADIGAFLQTVVINGGADKPEKEKPSQKTVDAVLRACKNYDITALKQAIGELDKYRYRAYPDLAEWLEEQAGKSNFETIEKRMLAL